MRIALLMLILLAALSAYAADYTTTIKCPTDVKHVPADDVAYKEGVSASGYGVAPADEVPPALTAEDFEQIDMGLDIPVSDYIANAANTPSFNDSESNLNVGTVTTNAKTGEVAFNGRDITGYDPALSHPDCW